MHKNATSFRYITCGTSSSLSLLSENVGYALKIILKYISNSTKYNCNFKNYNKNYIIDDSKDVVTCMDSANRNRKYGGSKGIRTYDFAIYIHRYLQSTYIRKFILDAFVKKNKKFININNEKAYFSGKRSKKSSVIFTCQELIEAVKYIIDNSFIKFNGKIYRQVIGILMGTSYAPYLVNIFLHVYESNYIDKLVTSNNLKEAVLLKYVFRYQEDGIVFNDKGYFESKYSVIYPKDLVLKNTNVSPKKSNYLDLTISIFYGK